MVGQQIHGVLPAAVGPDILRSGQMLLEETKEAGIGLARLFPGWHGNGAQGRQTKEGDHGVHRHGDTHAPVHGEVEHAKYADEKQQTANNPDGEFGEEIGQVADVAVDTFDHLPGRALVVECHIEAQAVHGQVFAQLVRRRPGQFFADIASEDSKNLLCYGHSQKQQPDVRHLPHVHIGAGRVDKGPHDLRIEELQADAREQQHRQRADEAPVG